MKRLFVTDFRELDLWQVSRNLLYLIFRNTEKFKTKSQSRFHTIVRKQGLLININIVRAFESTSTDKFRNHLSGSLSGLSKLEKILKKSRSLHDFDKTVFSILFQDITYLICVIESYLKNIKTVGIKERVYYLNKIKEPECRINMLEVQ